MVANQIDTDLFSNTILCENQRCFICLKLAYHDYLQWRIGTQFIKGPMFTSSWFTRYCQTFIIGGYLILAVSAVKTKSAKICPPLFAVHCTNICTS